MFTHEPDCLLFVVRLTVSEVKVKQMPPKPLRESAKKMSADKPVEWKKMSIMATK